VSDEVSRLLSLVLRHEPQRLGVVLDDRGFAPIDGVLAGLAANGMVLSRAELDAIVADRQRFAISDDGSKIRASDGEPVELERDLVPAVPPQLLYHGTTEAAVPGIRAFGLVKGERRHVHLSPDVDTARKVGARHGEPIVLTVRAGEMHAAGHAFYLSQNCVWLCDHVPADFVQLPFQHHAGGGNRAMKVEIARQSLDACKAGHYINRRGERVDIAAEVAACKAGTLTYELGAAFDPPREDRTAEVEVTGESTVAALCRLAPRGGHLACLNFASAKHAGGGFLGGAQAQEESIARASALYPCLVTQPEFYARQRAHGGAMYLDLAIWSPRVPVFRDDDGNWLDAPVLASVITCAAPNASALRQHGRFDAAEVERVLRARVKFILDIAVHHGVDHLVLGAWGAGVFGNDPAIVARAFAELMPRAFASVVYAVIGDPVRSENHRAFAELFG